MTTGIEVIAEGDFKMYLAREIDLNGLDADVLGSRCHSGRREQGFHGGSSGHFK